MGAFLEENQWDTLYTLSIRQIKSAGRSSARMNLHEHNPQSCDLRRFSDYQTLLRARKWEQLTENNTELGIYLSEKTSKPIFLMEKLNNDM